MGAMTPYSEFRNILEVRKNPTVRTLAAVASPCQLTLLFFADKRPAMPPQRPHRQFRVGCCRERQDLVDAWWTLPPYVPMMRHGPGRHGRSRLSTPAPCLLPDQR